MSPRKEVIIQSGTVLENTQIAAHTFHLKIQSNDFAQVHYTGGFTLDVFLGNPFTEASCEDRKYSIWKYEPIYRIADLAICTRSNGKGAKWIQKLHKGDRIFFKPPRGKLLADNSAASYLLIGDISSLSHLYEINRNLTVSKNVFSFIYAQQASDFFNDIDKSSPFSYHVVNPIQTDLVLEKIIQLLPADLDNTIAYIFGHPGICIGLHNYLKAERNMPLQNLRTKPFWKTDREDPMPSRYCHNKT